MRATGWVSLQQLVAGDQTLSALRQENLVAKFHRLARLAPRDQIGVSLKDGVDLLIHRTSSPLITRRRVKLPRLGVISDGDPRPVPQ